MSDRLAVLVPVLRRPHRVAPLLDAIETTTPGARVLFLADAADRPELDAIAAALPRAGLRVDVDRQGGNYAAKINRGVRATDEPYVFSAADDLEPQAGWLEAAIAAIEGRVQVVGVNDLIERDRRHATHFLFARAYAEQPTIDGRRGPFFEGYNHWWTDNELIATARHRRAYGYAADAYVLHLHPMADRAADDSTYRRGRARSQRDRQIFERRRHLWT